MSSKWYEFRIVISPEVKASFSDFLFDIGAQGINENVDFPNSLQAYFSAEKKRSAEAQILEFGKSLKKSHPNLPELKLEISSVPEENWAETYKKYYVAQYLTDLFFLRPKWDQETAIPTGMIPIIMDPGQAFGTGLHPSTRLCLKILQSQILENIEKENLRCLDVGTGSGILALAAYHLGVKEVFGIDNDPIAIEVAKENMLHNKAIGIELSTADIRELKAPFEFVISNILLETHRELSGNYERLVPTGGLLLLSGLLGYQKLDLLKFMTPLGFVLLESRYFQEWACFLFVKREFK